MTPSQLCSVDSLPKFRLPAAGLITGPKESTPKVGEERAVYLEKHQIRDLLGNYITSLLQASSTKDRSAGFALPYPDVGGAVF